MQAIKSNSAECFVYYGEREGWLVALSQNRDSDALERSNWSVISSDIMNADRDNVAIESVSHFLVGWVEYLLVRPDSPAATRAEEWLDRLESYPIADEDHFSALEWQEEWCLKCESDTREQHPTARCAKFRGEADVENTLYAWRHR